MGHDIIIQKALNKHSTKRVTINYTRHLTKNSKIVPMEGNEKLILLNEVNHATVANLG